MNHIFHVENIKCWWCMKTISDSLKEKIGVDSVNIDKDKQTITVTGQIDKKKISTHLTSLWYPPNGTGNFINKAKSYVSCIIWSLSS